MSLRKILLVTVGMYFMLNVSAQNSKRYYVAKPGTLVEMLTENEANQITHLTLQVQELLFPHPEATNPLLYIYKELQPFHTSQSALTEKNQ